MRYMYDKEKKRCTNKVLTFTLVWISGRAATPGSIQVEGLAPLAVTTGRIVSTVTRQLASIPAGTKYKNYVCLVKHEIEQVFVTQ